MFTIARAWDTRDTAALQDESCSMYIHGPKVYELRILSQVTAINVKAGHFITAVLCILLVLICAGFDYAPVGRECSIWVCCTLDN